MHKRLLLPLLLSPLLIAAGQSYAEPRLQSRVESFDVSGATVDTIRASLNRNRQHSANRVNWNFRWESTPGQCRITEATTDVSVTSYIPRLQPDPQRAAKLDTIRSASSSDRSRKEVWRSWWFRTLRQAPRPRSSFRTCGRRCSSRR